MDLRKALDVFEALEEHRYLIPECTAEFPVFNVRLDAMTDRGSDERSFRIFVRVDDGVADENRERYLRAVCDLAKKHKLTPVLENNGVELT